MPVATFEMAEEPEFHMAEELEVESIHEFDEDSRGTTPPSSELTATFDNLIAEFHTSGYAKDSARDVLKLFF